MRVFYLENGWAGVIINGAVRDAARLSTIDIGIKALAATPIRSNKAGIGAIDVPVLVWACVVCAWAVRLCRCRWGVGERKPIEHGAEHGNHQIALNRMIKNLTSHTLNLHDDMCGWRHDIHRHPELAFEENRTADMVANLLDDWGITVHRGVGKTGVVGVLRCGDGARAIGLRADMDALKIQEQNTFAHRSTHHGKMHACGHDGHMAMLLGAARHLAESARREQLNGTVVFIFQPAEEHGDGARAMIQDQLFERFPVDDVYAIHNFPSLAAGKFAVRTGTMMAAEDNFEITVTGTSCHAAMPHMGSDAIVIGGEIVTAMQTVVARTLNPTECAVISFTEFITDGTVNVVPGRVVLRGDTRSLTPTVQDHIETKMARIVAGVCAAHGVEHNFVYHRNFAPTINTPTQAEIAGAVAATVVGKPQVTSDGLPVMASEDFGYMLQAKPGAYILLGNGEGGVGGCSLHNSGYDFNDAILNIGADFWVELVLSQLTPQTPTSQMH